MPPNPPERTARSRAAPDTRPGPPRQSARAGMEALAALASPGRAASSAGFFKTGPGEYGEGDRFIGVPVPAQRAVMRSFPDLPLAELTALVDSPVHEHRLCAVIGAVGRFRRAADERESGISMLPDVAGSTTGTSSTPLRDRSSAVCSSTGHAVCCSSSPRSTGGGRNDLWLRRIAIIATQEFINRGDGSTTLELAPVYLDYPDDLLQKATGWMLREVGKRVDPGMLTGFLDEYASRMPRTMLGYAIEHLTVERRKHYRSLKNRR